MEANAIVVAAGTIETLRLMLVSGIGGDGVGRTFEDHASPSPHASGRARPLQNTYGMRTKGGLRYYPKLLLAQPGEGMPGCMANVVFRYPESSGLEALLRIRRAHRAGSSTELRDLLTRRAVSPPSRPAASASHADASRRRGRARYAS